MNSNTLLSISDKLQLLQTNLKSYLEFSTDIKTQYENELYHIMSCTDSINNYDNSYARVQLLKNISEGIDTLDNTISNAKEKIKRDISFLIERKAIAKKIQEEWNKIKPQFNYIDIPQGDIIVNEFKYCSDIAPDNEELKVGKIIAGDECKINCDYDGYEFYVELFTTETKHTPFLRIDIEVDYTDSLLDNDERSLYLYKKAENVTELNEFTISIHYKHPQMIATKQCSYKKSIDGSTNLLNKNKLKELLSFCNFIVKVICNLYPEYEYDEKFENLFSDKGNVSFYSCFFTEDVVCVECKKCDCICKYDEFEEPTQE